MPPFSSVVMTGTAFSFENTAIYSASTLQGSNNSSSGGGGIGGGSGGGSGAAGVVGAPSGGESASGITGGGGASGGGSTALTASSIHENMPDGRFHDGTGGHATPHGGTAETQMSDIGGGDGSGSGSYAMLPSIRQAVARYPGERQVYVDLMAVYTNNMARVQMLWGNCDRRKVVETMVQNILSVDQPLAAASRACLLDLLCPPSLGSAATTTAGPSERMFGSRAERLDGAMQAVVRATQLLRAVDERFSETLVGGIFSLDARSSMSFAQPGDPLVDGPGGWWLSYSQQQQQHLHQQYCARRFMHVANLSSASTASNHNSDIAGRGGDLEGRNDESYVRHAYSASAGQ
ncbi:hypothetical protein GGI21_005919, partial [Coemansia aciculifera]